jgi:hypothetical protein
VVGVDHAEHQSRRRLYHACALVGSIGACHGAVAYTAVGNATDPAANAAIQHSWSSDSPPAAPEGNAAHGPARRVGGTVREMGSRAADAAGGCSQPERGGGVVALPSPDHCRLSSHPRRSAVSFRDAAESGRLAPLFACALVVFLNTGPNPFAAVGIGSLVASAHGSGALAAGGGNVGALPLDIAGITLPRRPIAPHSGAARQT